MRKPRTQDDNPERGTRTEYNYDAMMQAFQTIGTDALTMRPQELAETDDTWTIAQWKQFVLHPKTKQYVRSEMDIVSETNLNKLISDSGDSNSVGKSQLINSLLTYAQKAGTKKDGPVFIYCHVPLTKDEMESPVVGRVEGKKVKR